MAIIDSVKEPKIKEQRREVALQTQAQVKRVMAIATQADDPAVGAAAQRIEQSAQRFVKAIYIHSHMDEENFDVSRIVQCCVGVPEQDGRVIPCEVIMSNFGYKLNDAFLGGLNLKRDAEGFKYVTNKTYESSLSGLYIIGPLTGNDQVSCGGCHSYPYRDGGAGAVGQGPEG